MSVQNSADVNTRPLILSEYPIALRKDNETIIQDASRTAVLKSRTLMAKQAVDSAIVVAAGGSNTGNGTVTLATVVGLNTLGEKIIPKAGAWVFTLTAALVGKITDPDGVDVITGIALNDGTTTVVKYAGLQFTVTDGATAFVAGDLFTLTVAANGKWTPYDASSILGADKPMGIYDPEGAIGDITAAALVAGDIEDIPILISGARFDSSLLVIENSGSLSDMVSDTGLTVEEYLRNKSLIAEGAIAGSSAENS